MSDPTSLAPTTGSSCYVLEVNFAGQVSWDLFFVYNQRDHIRALLRDMFFDNHDPDTVEMHRSQCSQGYETHQLWVIEHGRRTRHIDLQPLIHIPDSNSDDCEIDWNAFDAAVPATLQGPPLHHGEELQLQNARKDFTGSQLLAFHPDNLLTYGIQLWGDHGLSDEPRYVYTDPDPCP
ncbi:hypothetical protein [Actinomadura sp. 6N118]|uniref:hypothetical protein n=1 Tax=Actinomadura sp. 6N118 TaxID=3375151 RepID=UPI003788F829